MKPRKIPIFCVERLVIFSNFSLEMFSKPFLFSIYYSTLFLTTTKNCFASIIYHTCHKMTVFPEVQIH